jgi:hypothetical protein
MTQRSNAQFASALLSLAVSCPHLRSSSSSRRRRRLRHSWRTTASRRWTTWCARRRWTWQRTGVPWACALALALTARADACARPQLTDGDVPTAAEAVLLRPPGCLPTTALPSKR